jgi:ATP-dependent helicase HrpA
LEIENRKVPYGEINPKEATEIFIRAALVEEQLFPDKPAHRRDDHLSSAKNTQQLLATVGEERKLPPAYGFLEQNRQVRQKIETWQTRVRRHDLKNVDQALFEFYAKRIQNVSSLHELNRWLRDQPDQQVLQVTEADLTGGAELDYDASAFPDAVSIGGQPVEVSYAYAPGEEHDGVTVTLPVGLAESVSSASVDWSVPGLREEQIGELLRALPKSIRRELMPLQPKIQEIARELQPGSQTLRHDLARFISKKYGLQVTVANWPAEVLPQHLRPRIEVTNHFNKPFAAGRDLEELRTRLEKKQEVPVGQSNDWKRAAAKWERSGLTTWSFGDLPARITVTEGELPVYAWPGLALEGDHVALRLFHSDEAARRSNIAGVRRLIESALQKDLAWVQRDLRALVQFQPLLAGFMTMEELQASAFENLKRYILAGDKLPSLTEVEFTKAVEKARERSVGVVPQMSDRLGLILKARQDVARRCGPAAPAPKPNAKQTLSDFKQLGQAPAPAARTPIAAELDALVPPNFLDKVPFPLLVHLPRFLKALLIRAERAAQNPPKDQERARQVAPFRDALLKLQADPPKSPEARARIEEFRWMIEEFKVSLFAQELGTSVPVSPKRLEKQLEQIGQA